MEEIANKFMKQQEMCDSTSTLNSPAHAVNSSDATKGFQEIMLWRKEFDRLTKFLLETRQAYTQEQLKEAGFLDLSAKRNYIDILLKAPQVYYDGSHFSYKPKHDLKDKIQLLHFIQKFPEGIAIAELMDAYPSVGEDLQALEAAGQIWLLRNLKYRDDTAFPADPSLCPLVIDPYISSCDRSLKNRLHPRPVIVKRRQKKTTLQNSKLTNDHLSEMFKNIGL